MCQVCDHPNRLQIEDAVRRREPIDRIARLHAISATSLRRHRDGDHAVTRPAPEPKKPREKLDPFPDEREIRGMNEHRQRSNHLFRCFAERRWNGGKSIALYASLWRPYLGDLAELRIAEMASDAALRHARLRGTRQMKREEMILRCKRLAEKAERDGEYAAALASMKYEGELDGLLYTPDMLSSLAEAQAFRLIKPLIEEKAPQLLREIDRVLAGAERKRQKAIRVLEEGPEPGEHAALPETADEPEESIEVDAEAEDETRRENEG